MALTRPRMLLGAAAAGTLAAALWWRKNPSACPYGQRFWVEAPHPIISRARLRSVLRPEPGERLLEVGVGTGYYSLEIAEWIGPEGRLDLFDLQREFLDHTLAAAGARLDPEEGDLAEVDGDRPLLGREVVPAALLELLAQVLEIALGEPGGDHLAAFESDLDSLCISHQCPPAGSTISVSTPPVERG